MKHLRKFENLDFKDKLAAESELRKKYEDAERQRIENLRIEKSGKYLPELVKDTNKTKSRIESEEERAGIVQRVIDGLVADLNRNAGYRSFKEELLAFLGEFPKE